jgi:hypothetical protein
MYRTTRVYERRYGLLLIATLASLAVQGMLPTSAVQQVLVAVLAAASLLLALRAAQLSERLLAVAAVLAGLVVAVSVVRALDGGIGEGAARAANAAILAFGPPAIALGLIRDLRTSGAVHVETLAGVLSLYILLGMIFGFLYGTIDQVGNAPFFAGGQPGTVSNCLYFSFITLTTVGYGDFVAKSDVGHTLAVFEALLGQIYLVTIVSVIVGNLRRRPRD